MNRLVFKTKVHANFSPYGYFSPICMVIVPIVDTIFNEQHTFPAPLTFIQFHLVLIPKQFSLPYGYNSEDTESKTRDNGKWEWKPEVPPRATLATSFESKVPGPWTAAHDQYYQ